MKNLMAIVGLLSICLSASAEVDRSKLARCLQNFLAEYDQVLLKREDLAVRAGSVELTATTSGEFAQLAMFQSAVAGADAKISMLDQKFDAAIVNGRESENIKSFCREYSVEL